MKIHNLAPLLNPQSIAVIGASDTSYSLGQTLFANIISGAFKGQIYPVNLNHKRVGGLPAYSSVTKIKGQIDLAIVLTPVHTYLTVIQECVQKGVKAVLFNRGNCPLPQREQTEYEQALLLAREKKIRVLGHSFLGMMRPVAGLNASTYSCQMFSGNLGLVTQSSSLATAIIDWAERKEIGFSSLIAVDHESVDVGIGDILDFLSNDSATEAVLLQVHHIQNGRRFISGLRALARKKPVVVIKAGVSENYVSGGCVSARMIKSHEVFKSAIERTGALYINTISEIFTSINALSSRFKITDKRLMIISNGQGVATLAKDRATRLDVEMPALADETIERLNQGLPVPYRPKEPIDLLDDAPPVRFRHAVQLSIEDKNVDGVLVILAPQMGTDHLTTARLLVDLQGQTKKPIFFSWLGEAKVNDSYTLFSREHSACFRMPEHAIEAFKTLADYQRNQKLLSQIPVLTDQQVIPDVDFAREIIDKAIRNHYRVLPEHLAQQVFAAFGVSVPESILVTTAKQAEIQVKKMVFPLMMKVDSPELIDVVDIENFSRTISDAGEVVTAFNTLLEDAKKQLPDKAKIYGVNISSILPKKASHEIMVSLQTEPTFGPVISFSENIYYPDNVPSNYAVALPPLNDYLVQDLIMQTHIGRNMNLPKNRQLRNHRVLKNLLLAVSQMASLLPKIAEICLNPVWVEEKTIVLPRIKMVLHDKSSRQSLRNEHMAIMPYPHHTVTEYKLTKGEHALIRPIKPEDAPLLQNLVKNMSEESRFFRYLSNIKQLPHNLLVQFTQIDYDREMAFVLIRTSDAGEDEMLGVARYTTEPDEISCEFAVEVADDWQGNGIATVLMYKLFIAAKEQGLETMHGEVLAENESMLKFVKKMGFHARKLPEDPDLVFVEKNLSAAADVYAKASLLANKVRGKITPNA